MYNLDGYKKFEVVRCNEEGWFDWREKEEVDSEHTFEIVSEHSTKEAARSEAFRLNDEEGYYDIVKIA